MHKRVPAASDRVRHPSGDLRIAGLAAKPIVRSGAAAEAGGVQLVLDLSRLLSRLLNPTPTGVDRVEMAYARGLMSAAPDRLSFAAVQPSGRYGRLGAAEVGRFLDRLEARWERDGHISAWEQRRFAVGALARLWPGGVPASTAAPRVYVQASPHHLTRPMQVSAILRREQARFICLVHDLIPLDYPEYARPDGAAQHRTRIATIVNHADGIIANSHATMASLKPWIQRSGRNPAVGVAHLGTYARAAAHGSPASAGGIAERPYFVCLGTIEPRKNHLLLLNVWRRLVERRGPGPIPRLVLIGRRGWENEQVVDMLERCPALTGNVDERPGISDSAVRGLLAGARALLMPSFAEGYGMPITEAMQAGVPVICSDLPALREAGDEVPEFLDPLDGPAWIDAVVDYTRPGSLRRAAQLRRLAQWAPPRWQDHIAILLGLVQKVTDGQLR